MATFRELHASARAHQKPRFDAPDLVVNNSRGAEAPPTVVPAKVAPTFHQLHASARAHQRSASEVDGLRPMNSDKPVDQVDGRNPFYRPPIVIPAEGLQGEGDGLLGQMVRAVVVPSAGLAIKVGKAFQENAHMGEVGRLPLAYAEPRIYMKFPWGPRQPLPKVTEAWGAANQVIDKVGAGLQGMGAGIIAATGNMRPLFDAAMSRNTAKRAPTLVQPLVDDAVKHGMDKAYGRDKNASPSR
jgi:hypothetical protein